MKVAMRMMFDFLMFKVWECKDTHFVETILKNPTALDGSRENVYEYECFSYSVITASTGTMLTNDLSPFFLWNSTMPSHLA